MVLCHAISAAPGKLVDDGTRWQFRGGIAEKDRKAFLFTNVTDGKGRKKAWYLG